MAPPAPLPVVTPWFAAEWVTPRTAVLTEPHMHDLLQANLWYLRGRDRDLLVDIGNGISALTPVLAGFARGEPQREVVAVATHAHSDHIGGFPEFARRLLHPAEVEAAARIGEQAPLLTATWVAKLGKPLNDGGVELPPVLVDAVPHPGFDPAAFRIVPATPTRLVQGGDEIDLGDRCFTVIELPGHTPGSIGLIDHEENALLSGDAVDEGELLDTLPESDIELYLRTMEWLRTLAVGVVYPGHGDAFGCERLHELAEAYLREHGT